MNFESGASEYAELIDVQLVGSEPFGGAGTVDIRIQGCVFDTGATLTGVTFLNDGQSSSAVRFFTFTISGTLEVNSGKIRIWNRTGADLTLLEFHIGVDTVPTGASILVDLNENGSTVFSTQANRPEITATENEGVTTTFDNATWANGNYLTVDVDQIGSIVAGADLTGMIKCS